MKTIVVLLVLATPMTASAQFKCTDAEGKVTFQQTACAKSGKQEPLKLRTDAPSRAASDVAAEGGSVEQRMVRKLERDRVMRGVEDEIRDTEGAIANRNNAMVAEIAALRQRKASANNNLSGATFEQSVSTEMNAVAAKFKALNEIDIERLKQLRVDLAAAKREAASK